MTYALIKNGVVIEYPYSPSRLRRDNPNVSFPTTMDDTLLASFDVIPIVPAARPAYDPVTQDVVETSPSLLNGVWTQGWAIMAANPADVAERQLEAADAAASAEVKLDTFVTSFLAMTPAQVNTYIENNTANLAATRALLKKMAIMLLVLARRELR